MPERPELAAGDPRTEPSPGPSPEPVDASLPAATHPGPSPFTLHLSNFEGPFDLLLQLISRHKLDVTEVSLSSVTDEFIAHIKAAGANWDLEQTSSFIVVAATLLDLKAARLIPSGEVEDAEDLALLEARDLLFARLLQYRAYKQVAAYLSTSLTAQGRRHPRDVGLEARFARLVPELTIAVTPERFAAIAAKALAPKQADVVSLAHLHAPAVSVREQAGLVVDRLRRARTMTFRALTGDAPDVITTVCRFLALLELFRDAAVAFEQLTPLGELTIRWTGTDTGDLTISDEFDEAAGAPPAEPVETQAEGGMRAELVEAHGNSPSTSSGHMVAGGGMRAELVEAHGDGPSTSSGHMEADGASTSSGHMVADGPSRGSEPSGAMEEDA